MENIRIGNSVHVSWRLYNNNGSQYVLSGKVRRLWIISAALEKEISSYGIQGRNELVFSIPADDLIRYGTYKIRLTIRESESGTEDAAYELTQVFQVVSKSYPNASGAVSGVVELPFTTVLNNVVVERIEGLSAYEIAVNNGYEGTEQEWVAEYNNALNAATTAAADASAAITAFNANEQARIEVENERVAAEQARVLAEAGRVSAESTRVSNESGRVAAEEARVSAEAGRVTAESGRVDAESSRVSAESSRVSAESSRVSAESARATRSASDHTRAENDHSLAVSDHSTASSDHTTAAGDHTTAVSDHTRAENDHTTAAADHTTAGGDHTTATGDHTQAVADHTQAASDHTASVSATADAIAAAAAATEAAESIEQSDWSENDSDDPAYIKGRTHWDESVVADTIKVTGTGVVDSSNNVDLLFSLDGTGLSWPSPFPLGGAALSIGGVDYLLDLSMGYISLTQGSGFPVELAEYEEEYSYGTRTISVPSTITIPDGIDASNVHKLDNKFLDLDSTPTLNSQKPVTSDGVKRAINAIPSQEQSDWNETVSSDPAYIKNKPDDLVHYDEVSPTDPINVPQYATEEEVNQLRSEINGLSIDEQWSALAPNPTFFSIPLPNKGGKTIKVRVYNIGENSSTFYVDARDENASRIAYIIPQTTVASGGSTAEISYVVPQTMASIGMGVATGRSIYRITVTSEDGIVQQLNEKLDGGDVIDSLDSSETRKPLSANQGKNLNDLLNRIVDTQNNFTEGYYLDSTGTPVADTDSCYSDYIPVSYSNLNDVGIVFYYGTYNANARLCIYDANKNFIEGFAEISGLASRTLTKSQLDESTAFIRFSFAKGYDGKLEDVYSREVYYLAKSKETIKGLVQPLSLVGNNMAKIEVASLTDGQAAEITDFPQALQKNGQISFYAELSTFGNGFTLGRGTTEYGADFIKIDDTNIEISNKKGSSTVVYARAAHGLTFSTFVKVIVSQREENLFVVIVTLNGIYTHQFIDVKYNHNGNTRIQSDGASFTNITLCAANQDIRCPIWMFGDSYFGADTANREMYYLIREWNFSNFLLCGFPGADSSEIFPDLKRLLLYGTPKFIVWCMGMNDGTTATMYSEYLTMVEELCEENGIELILQTIPSVPSINKSAINAVILASGHRYIDAAKAVGANSAGEWYNHGLATDYLSSDNVHPSDYGARAIASQFLVDFPEIMQY